MPRKAAPGPAPALLFDDLYPDPTPPAPAAAVAAEEPPRDEPFSEEDRSAYERGELQELAGVLNAEETEALEAEELRGQVTNAGIPTDDDAIFQCGKCGYFQPGKAGVWPEADCAQCGSGAWTTPLEATAEDVEALEEYTGTVGEALPPPIELDAQPLQAPRYINVDRPEPSAAEVLAETDRALARAEEAEAQVTGAAIVARMDAELAPQAETAQTTDPSTGSVGTKLEADTSAAGDGSSAPSAPGGFSLFGHNLFGDAIAPPSSGPLSDRFTLPPFTVFDARQGIWQDRKRAWIALGIQSEVGRGDNLIGRSPHDMFSHETGIAYKEAREIVAAAIAEQGDAFDIVALIEKYGRRRSGGRAFGQDFTLGPQPKKLKDGSISGEGKSWPKKEPAATAVSQRLAPGGGGGGCWLGGPQTASSGKFKHHTVSSGKAMEYAGFTTEQSTATSGTSIFDPTLTELLYRWFVPPSGAILDPFAGGSVRGIVASKLGFLYCGIELRPEQIAANEIQAEKICATDQQRPFWIEGDAAEAKALTEGSAFDFVMACPPYADLEQYSDDPRDLSNMEYPDFAAAYARIIAGCVELLKPDRFACFVIGDVRDPEGFYRGLPELTVKAFEDAGARKYNEAVLVTSVGSLPIRVGKQFNAGRKLGKTHQNVLIFCKGDPKRAAEACNGQLELSV